MSANCHSTRIYNSTEVVTEATPYGPLSYTKQVIVHKQEWTNYPGKVSEFTNYAVNTYHNGRLIGGHITGTLPSFAQ